MTRADTVHQGEDEQRQGPAAVADPTPVQPQHAEHATPAGNGRTAARDDLLYENLGLAFPRMRGFWREADPWTRGAYDRMRRAQAGNGYRGGLLELLLQPLLRRLQARPRYDPERDAGARGGGGQGDGAISGELERLSRVVQELEKSVTQIASRPAVVQAPARDVRFRHQPRQKSSEHSAVLKEIFETNLELRRTMHEGTAAPSEQAA